MKTIRNADEVMMKVLPPVCLSGETTYSPSQFTLPFEHNGKNYVFHNLTKQCIEGSLPSSAKPGEGYDEMIKARFLVPEDKDEDAFYTQISALLQTFRRPSWYRQYTIFTTSGCNARCAYCFEEGMKPVAMTTDTAEQVVRFIQDTHNGRQVGLTWFGGEPLLGTEVIDRISEGLREAGIAFKATILSNGSLVTPEIIQKMTGDWNVSSIQVSMDGSEKDYIARKRYYNDHDYYHQVMNAMNLMSSAGIKVTVRCNVDEENWDGIPQFLSDMHEYVQNKDLVRIYFYPLYSVLAGENDLVIWKRIMDAATLIEDAGFCLLPNRFYRPKFRIFHCMADANNVVISPDGSLYPCEHCKPESRFGDIWNGTTDEEADRKYRSSGQPREKCRKCPFLPDCTAYAMCPVHENHCRETREMMMIDGLKHLVEEKSKVEISDGEDPVC